MTNEEAREVLKELRVYTEDLPHYSSDEVAEALDMVIKAHEDIGYEQGYADGFAECLELNT